MKKKVTLILFVTIVFTTLSFTYDSKYGDTITPATISTIGAQTLRDVSYASTSKSQIMNIDIPAGAGPFPAVILIHGGAFKVGDKQEMETTKASKLVANGYVAISINYRLSGEAIFPAAVHDVKAAIRFVRANASKYRINPDKIATWGESAGGYLSSIVGVSSGDAYLEGKEGDYLATSSAIQACIDWYGNTNFSTMALQAKALEFPETYETNRESQFLGVADVSDPVNKDIIQKSSLATYIDSNDPPFWIQVGSDDIMIPNTQSLNFYKALKKVMASSKVGFEMLTGAGHGGTQFNNDANLNKSIAFLNAYLKKIK